MKRSIPMAALALAAGSVHAQIQDGGFEAGAFAGHWNEFSTNFGTPICNETECGAGGSAAPAHGGTNWAWFGGFNGYENGIVSQDATIASDVRFLEFYLEAPRFYLGGSDYLVCTVDAQELFRIDASNSAQYAEYAQVLLDVSAFADNGIHTVEFFSEVFGGPLTNDHTNIFVDDVSLRESLCRCGCDFDTSTGPGVCDIFDFLAFQTAFVTANPCACDLDITTGPGVCDVFDFLSFQNGFVSGCP